MVLLLSDSKRTSTNPQLIEPPYLAHGLTGSSTGSLAGLFCFLIGLGIFLHKFTIQLDFHRASLLPGRCFTTASSTAARLQSAFFASLLQSFKAAGLGRPQLGGGASADGHSILPCCPSAGGEVIYGHAVTIRTQQRCPSCVCPSWHTGRLD